MELFTPADAQSRFETRELARALEIAETIPSPRTIFSSSAKVEKTLAAGRGLQIAHYLPPGLFCSHSTAGCRSVCLACWSGRMKSGDARRARDERAAELIRDPELYVVRMIAELADLARRARARGLRALARLNGGSDIDWQELAPEIFETARRLEIGIADYTKDPARALRSARELEPRWWNVYSVSESRGSVRKALEILRAGGSVSVVYARHKTEPLPANWYGFRVVDGDEHDDRGPHERRRVIGLRAKGAPARRDQSGFVR